MNVNKLRGKIVEKGMSIESVANNIGVDRSTLYRKINSNGDTLTVSEANLICKILELSEREAMSIFFTNYVA